MSLLPKPRQTPPTPVADEIYKPGGIDADIVQNVFTEAKRAFELAVWPVGGQPSRAELLEFLDAIRLEIYQKASRMRDSAPRRTPPKRDEPANTPDSRAAYEAYRASMRGAS